MGGLLIFLIIIVCIILGLIVLVQNSKGGGLSSTFGGGNQIMGARKTTDFLEKTTWTLAIILVSLALLSNFSIPRSTSEENNLIEDIRPDNTGDTEDGFEDFDIQKELDITNDNEN